MSCCLMQVGEKSDRPLLHKQNLGEGYPSLGTGLPAPAFCKTGALLRIPGDG